MTLVEKHVIEEMEQIVEGGGDVIETVLKLVQPCQIHNADQLSDWSLSYIANNYNTACRRCNPDKIFSRNKIFSLVDFRKYFAAWCQKIRPISTSTDGHQFGRISTFSEKNIYKCCCQVSEGLWHVSKTAEWTEKVRKTSKPETHKVCIARRDLFRLWMQLFPENHHQDVSASQINLGKDLDNSLLVKYNLELETRASTANNYQR